MNEPIDNTVEVLSDQLLARVETLEGKIDQLLLKFGNLQVPSRPNCTSERGDAIGNVPVLNGAFDNNEKCYNIVDAGSSNSLKKNNSNMRPSAYKVRRLLRERLLNPSCVFAANNVSMSDEKYYCYGVDASSSSCFINTELSRTSDTRQQGEIVRKKFLIILLSRRVMMRGG